MQDSERLQLRSQDLEHQLSSKEKELEHIFQKQKRVSATHTTRLMTQVKLEQHPLTQHSDIKHPFVFV